VAPHKEDESTDTAGTTNDARATPAKTATLGRPHSASGELTATSQRWRWKKSHHWVQDHGQSACSNAPLMLPTSST